MALDEEWEVQIFHRIIPKTIDISYNNTERQSHTLKTASNDLHIACRDISQPLFYQKEEDDTKGHYGAVRIIEENYRP